MKRIQYRLLPKPRPHLSVVQPALLTRLCGPSHSSITVPPSTEEMLQNKPVQRLNGDNHTTGLPSGRLATRPGEFNISFKPQYKDNKSNWLRHVIRTNSRMKKVMLNYRPNVRRRLGRSLKILLEEVETVLSRPNSRLMMMMMMIKACQPSTFCVDFPSSGPVNMVIR